MTNLTDEELASFDLVQTNQEWYEACRRVKKARGGKYPPDWYSKVIASGLIERITARWGAKAEFRVESLDENGDVTQVATLPIVPKNKWEDLAPPKCRPSCTCKYPKLCTTCSR